MAVQDLIARSREMRRESEELRIKAIRARIEATRTFCSSAEIEARWEAAETAAASLEKVRAAIEQLYRHIERPEHVPAAMRGELHGQIAAIETKMRKVREDLSRRTAREKERGGRC